MSTLIDSLVISSNNPNLMVHQEICGLYYIAKPCQLQGLPGIIPRIKDAYRVLIGKSRAYHYKEDELED